MIVSPKASVTMPGCERCCVAASDSRSRCAQAALVFTHQPLAAQRLCGFEAVARLAGFRNTVGELIVASSAVSQQSKVRAANGPTVVSSAGNAPCIKEPGRKAGVRNPVSPRCDRGKANQRCQQQ
jgi:hypothetical protein